MSGNSMLRDNAHWYSHKLINFIVNQEVCTHTNVLSRHPPMWYRLPSTNRVDERASRSPTTTLSRATSFKINKSYICSAVLLLAQLTEQGAHITRDRCYIRSYSNFSYACTYHQSLRDTYVKVTCSFIIRLFLNKEHVIYNILIYFIYNIYLLIVSV